MITAFQPDLFQTDAFQIDSGLIENGGDYFDYGFKKKRKKSRRVELETEERQQLESAISEIYDRIHGLTPEVQKEVIGTLGAVTGNKPAADSIKASIAALPPIPEIDVKSLMENVGAAERLLKIHKQIMLEEEEAAVFLLLMM